MESTGIYGRPVYARLVGQFEVLVVNAQHMKAVPGRKVRREVAQRIAPERKLLRSLLFHQQYSWVAKRGGNDPW
jgi:transposase